MPWIVKRFRQYAFAYLSDGEDELRIVHTDGRETSHSLYLEDETLQELREDEEPPDLDDWKSNAEGVALAMNEADEIAEVSGLDLRYPRGIEIFPGYWRVQNSVVAKVDYFRRNDYIANIKRVTWRVYCLGPLGEEETIAEGKYSFDSDDTSCDEIEKKEHDKFFNATFEAGKKVSEKNDRRNSGK